MTSGSGLRWVVALPSEAAPLIEHYQLELVCDHPFKLYADRARDQGLVISGMGRSAAAAATVFIAERLPLDASPIFLNVGIAGAAKLKLGTIWRVHQVRARSTGKVWYPGAMKFKECGSAGLTTVEQPELEYPGDGLFDMEAAGFFEMASKFTSLELIQSLKIVSDNAEEDIQGIDKHRVKQWVRESLSVIDGFRTHVLALRETGADERPPREWEEQILDAFRFSVTQGHQLRSLISRYWALVGRADPLMDILSRAEGSKEFMAMLSDYILSQPVAWGER